MHPHQSNYATTNNYNHIATNYNHTTSTNKPQVYHKKKNISSKQPHYASPYLTTLHHTTLHHAKLHLSHLKTPHYTTPHHTTPHHTTPHHTTPHHTTPHHTTPHHTTPHHTTPHHTTPHYTTPHHTTPHHSHFKLQTIPRLDGSLQLRLEVVKALNREEEDSLKLKVHAFDGGHPPKFGTLMVGFWGGG